MLCRSELGLGGGLLCCEVESLMECELPVLVPTLPIVKVDPAEVCSMEDPGGVCVDGVDGRRVGPAEEWMVWILQRCG